MTHFPSILCVAFTLVLHFYHCENCMSLEGLRFLPPPPLFWCPFLKNGYLFTHATAITTLTTITTTTITVLSISTHIITTTFPTVLLLLP